MQTKNYIGLDGFVWWFGVIENRIDPLNLGRCQVRVFGRHTQDKSFIPTDDLPWALPMLPVNSSQTIVLKDGDMVVGFFTDGESSQQPIIMGVIPGIPQNTPPISLGFSDQRTEQKLSNSPRPPKSKKYNMNGSGVVITEESQAQRNPYNLNEPTTSRISRNEKIDKTIIQERMNNVVNVPTATGSWTEPKSDYNPVFPYNKVVETESGHVFEIDDTPSHERISKSHRTGTFEEIHPDGSKVTKVVKDNYEIIMSDEKVYIMGSCDVTIQGNASLYVKGNYNVKVDGNVNEVIGGNYKQTIGGTSQTVAGGNLSVKAPKIDWN